jgi:hypothetical protein
LRLLIASSAGPSDAHSPEFGEAPDRLLLLAQRVEALGQLELEVEVIEPSIVRPLEELRCLLELRGVRELDTQLEHLDGVDQLELAARLALPDDLDCQEGIDARLRDDLPDVLDPGDGPEDRVLVGVAVLLVEVLEARGRRVEDVAEDAEVLLYEVPALEPARGLDENLLGIRDS